MSQPTAYASGLQPERTALAWRRTVLSLFAGSLLAIRLLAASIGNWSVLAGVLGLILTALVWFMADRRERVATAAIATAGPAPGGGLLLLLVVFVTAGALVGVLYALSQAVQPSGTR